jgi:hypothetical protein
MRTLVGSQAAKQHFSDFREPKDVDYFSETPVDGAEVFYHPDLEKWDWGEVATIDELYTIKVSHSFWELKNNTWSKHMVDILFFQRHDAQFIPELYNILYPIWEERYGKKRANLEQSPEEFFNNRVVRIYEHDSIHASVAYNDEPMFNRILRDGHQVAVDRSKFENMSSEDKNKLVREEVYATALERVLIPSEYKEFARKGYDYALKKTITSFTKGWFPLYIVLNFDELKKADVDYVKVHKNNADKLIPLENN